VRGGSKEGVFVYAAANAKANVRSKCERCQYALLLKECENFQTCSPLLLLLFGFLD
jgi:hypothetical protein